MTDFKYRFLILDYRIIDGDSVVMTLDLGLGLRTTETVRLADLDAPEVRTRDLEEKAAGIRATDWLVDAMGNADELILEALMFNRGKFGRLIGYVIADGVNLNNKMVAEGLASPYQ